MRMPDDEVNKRFTYADRVTGGASSVLRAEFDRARTEEKRQGIKIAEQTEIIKELAGMLDAVRQGRIDRGTHWHVALSFKEMDAIEDMLRKVGRLP